MLRLVEELLTAAAAAAAAALALCLILTLLGQVPDGVRFLTVKTDAPADTDVGCILLCPQNSEADFALDLLKKVCFPTGTDHRRGG